MDICYYCAVLFFSDYSIGGVGVDRVCRICEGMCGYTRNTEHGCTSLKAITNHLGMEVW